MSTRAEVIAAIDSERTYQDHVWPGPGDAKLLVGEELTLLRHYTALAEIAWATRHRDDEALEIIRKITAIGFRCMENHAAPKRDLRIKL